MENILKNPGLQHIIITSFIFLEKSDIASIRLVNQNCKNIVDDLIFSLKKLSQIKDVPKDLIENWKKIIQNLQHSASEIKYEILKELNAMFYWDVWCPKSGLFHHGAKYPLELAYKLAETKSNPELVTAILENADPKSYIEASKPLTGNLRPIHLAACFGYVQAARTMIHNSTPVNLKDEYDRTPIFFAAHNGHYNMVQELLGFSANPNICSINGITPIHWAAKNGHVEIVQLLMPLTDNPNAPANNGVTPIHWAAKNGHVEIVYNY